MSAPIDDGGPAFPHINHGGSILEAPGMSLRDWFAGQALAGLLANGGSQFWEQDGINAYAAADAMLAARKERHE